MKIRGKEIKFSHHGLQQKARHLSKNVVTFIKKRLTKAQIGQIAEKVATSKYSIGFKLGAFLLTSMLIMGLIIGLIIVPYTASVVTETIGNQSEVTVKSHLKSIRLYVEDTITGMSILGKSIAQLETENEIRFLFTEVASKNQKYNRLSFINPSGQEVVKTGIDGSKYFNRSTDPVFTEALKKEVYVSPILPDSRLAGKYYIDIAILVKDGTGVAKGVLVTRISPDLIISSVNENKTANENNKQAEANLEEKSTLLLMLNHEGNLVSTSNQKLLEKLWTEEKKEKVTLETVTKEEITQHEAVSEMNKTIEQWNGEEKVISNTGVFDDQYGESQVVAYAYDATYQWSLFLQTNKNEALADVSIMKNVIIIVIFFGSILLSVLSIIFIRRNISKPMSDLMIVTQEISQGDLTKKTNIKRKDEIGILAESFDQMVEGLRIIVQKVKNSSDETSQRANELSHVAKEVSEGANQVAITIQEIAKGAEHQSTLSYKTEDGVEQLHQMVSTITTRANEVSKQAEITQKTIRTSDQVLENLIMGMDTLANTTMDSAQNVKQLQDYTKTIGEITVASNEIAKKTNLLALNAAIEAARAGEHGRGFAVVANEIRQLAEQSTQSSEKIREIIGAVRRAIEVVVGKMEESVQMVSNESRKTSESKEAFRNIEVAMNQVMESMSSIIYLIQQQKEVTENIHDQAKESSQVSMETSSGAEEVAASSEESAAIMEQVVDNADYLMKMAKELQESVEIFKV